MSKKAVADPATKTGGQTNARSGANQTGANQANTGLPAPLALSKEERTIPGTALAVLKSAARQVGTEAAALKRSVDLAAFWSSMILWAQRNYAACAPSVVLPAGSESSITSVTSARRKPARALGLTARTRTAGAA
jgi:hypothetical protein